MPFLVTGGGMDAGDGVMGERGLIAGWSADVAFFKGRAKGAVPTTKLRHGDQGVPGASTLALRR